MATPQTHVNEAYSRLPAVAGAMLILLGALVAYSPALSGDLLWDDDDYVGSNPLLFSADGLWHIWASPEQSPQYYPLVFTSFWLEARLWGLSTLGLHVVNVLLHAVSGVLLWRVLRLLGVPGAWLAGAIFALHPVHVESVAWISERKNVLSGLFYLLAAISYFRYADTCQSKPRWGLLVWSLALYACAIFSKTVTCTLPAALALCCWWRRGRLSWRELWPLGMFAVIGVPAGLWTVWLEKHHVGAAGELWDLSVVERFLVAGRALWFYMGKLVCPVNLTFNYPRWSIDAAVWWQYLFPAGFALLVAALWAKRRQLGRGPLVAVLLFAGTLTPALGFFDVYPFQFSFVADHFQYHASMGLIALIAAGVTIWLRRLTPVGTGLTPRGISGLVVLLPAACGILAFDQAKQYTDARTLWRETIALNPASWLACYNLGLDLARNEEPDSPETAEARKHLEQALVFNPKCGGAHVALGLIAAREGRDADAVSHYEAALRLDPGDFAAAANLANLLRRIDEESDPPAD